MTPGVERPARLTVNSNYCRLNLEHQARPDTDADTPRRFWFFGGHLALDFVNTEMIEGGTLIDVVAHPEELGAWVAASSLGSEFGEPGDVAASVHAEAIMLRRALREAFDALVTGEPVPDTSLATMNDILATGPGTLLRRSGDGGLSRAVRVDLKNDSGPLPWLLADTGANLIASDMTAHLKRCANHATCVLMFLDTSRSHTRRWCSMELCGNRSKVAAHNERSRRKKRETYDPNADSA